MKRINDLVENNFGHSEEWNSREVQERLNAIIDRARKGEISLVPYERTIFDVMEFVASSCLVVVTFYWLYSSTN